MGTDSSCDAGCTGDFSNDWAGVDMMGERKRVDSVCEIPKLHLDLYRHGPLFDFILRNPGLSNDEESSGKY